MTGQFFRKGRSGISIPTAILMLATLVSLALALASLALVAGPFILRPASELAFTAPTGSTENEPGLDGVPADGDAHFRVTFRIIGVGESLFRIDAEPPFGAAIGTLDGYCFVVPTEVALRVIPEPSSAMLILLGLLGFAWPHRRNA